MIDRIEYLPDGSLIQHGTYNDRIYLMKASGTTAGMLPEILIEKARRSGYSKIFAKVPASFEERFLVAGYLREAIIPGLFKGKEDGVLLGYFRDKRRLREPDRENFSGILRLAAAKAIVPWKQEIRGFRLRQCKETDVVEMAELYQNVFPSYPFPIYEPSFLLTAMREKTVYFVAIAAGKMVALASAETDPDSSSVEMTDFATLPEWRGNRLAAHLLEIMETSMRKHGFRTAFSIARAISRGMNITFARFGYHLGGRLRNNTNISGHIESMNVWYKKLLED